MAYYNKHSRIGTILHDKNSYQEEIQRQNTPETEENEEDQHYMSIDEYRLMMNKIRYTQMIQAIQLKQEKKNQSTENLFRAFFCIPIYVYKSVCCTHSKISNL